MKAIAAKGAIFLFFVYLVWFRAAHHHVSLYLYGGTALVAITTLLYVNHKPFKCLIPPKGIMFWMGFAIYSLVVGLVVASDRNQLISSVVTYMAFLFVCYCAYIISRGENDIQWLIKVIIIVCYICAVYTLFWGKPYQTEFYVTTMGPENNPNTLGTTMVFGMFAVLYSNKQKLGGLVFIFATLTLFTYVIVLTGSRKALLSALVLGVIWFAAFLRDAWKNYKRRGRFLRISLVVAGACFAIAYFTNAYADTASFERMLMLFAKGGMDARQSMYAEAFDMFKTSPLFGIGYDQYRLHSSYGTYSHATYAEVLSCGGIFGSLIYFTPVIWTGYLIYKKLKNEKSYRVGILFALYAVEMFLGTGNIFMYSFMHMTMWTIMFMLLENDEIYKSDIVNGVQ